MKLVSRDQGLIKSDHNEEQVIRKGGGGVVDYSAMKMIDEEELSSAFLKVTHLYSHFF